jgi:hypothetical protein
MEDYKLRDLRASHTLGGAARLDLMKRGRGINGRDRDL